MPAIDLRRLRVILLMALFACGDTASSISGDATPSARPAVEVTVGSVSDTFDRDTHRAQVKFWSARAMEGAVEVYLQRSLEDMIQASTAVIFGTVVGQVEGPLVDEDAPDGQKFHLTAYEVRVDELVSGTLPVGNGTILLTPTGRLGADEAPDGGRNLMFLTWGGTGYEEGWAGGGPPEIEEWSRSVYALISSQGLYIDSPEGAWNPIAAAQEGYRQDDPTKLVDPVAEEARQYTLNELADLARRLKGDTG